MSVYDACQEQHINIIFLANLGKSLSAAAGASRGLRWCEKIGVFLIGIESLKRVVKTYKMTKELDGWECGKSEEFGLPRQMINCADDHKGTKCKQRNYEEDFGWKFGNEVLAQTVPQILSDDQKQW